MDALDAAKGFTTAHVDAVRVQDPLCKGRETLANGESFLLTGKVPVEVQMQRKHRFVKGCNSY